jgi:hypothetical protein
MPAIEARCHVHDGVPLSQGRQERHSSPCSRKPAMSSRKEGCGSQITKTVNAFDITFDGRLSVGRK